LVGLALQHPERYAAVITRAITGPSGIPAEQVHTPDPDRADLGETCADDDRLVSKAGIDLQPPRIHPLRSDSRGAPGVLVRSG
jgi:hypothetical protein